MLEQLKRIMAPAKGSTPVVLRPYTRKVGGRWRLTAGLFLLALLCFACLIWGFFFALTVPYFLPPFVGPIGVLALLVIWALPDTKRAPTGAIALLFFAFFLSNVLWPNYLALTLKGLPWITTTRLFGFPLAILTLICISTSPEFRGRIAAALQATPLIWKLTTAFAVIMALTCVFAKHPADSINLMISYQISWILIFFVSCYVFLSPGAIERWALLLWGACIVLCVIGVWENKLGHVPWADHIPSFLAVGDEFVQRVLQGARRLGVGAYRVQANQSTSLGLAEILALATPFAIHFMASDKYPRALRIVAGVSIPAFFYVILLTDARLGVVGFFLSVLMYVFAWSVLRWRYVKNSLLGPALTIAYPLMAVGFLALSFLWQRLRVVMWGGNEASSSSQARVDQYSEGIPLVLSHPWGYGVGMGASALGYTNGAGTLTIDTYYLAVALDYGVLGFLVYYAALLATIYYAARAIYSVDLKSREDALLIPTCIALTAFFVIKSIFSQPQNHPVAFMMMAIVTVVAYRLRVSAPATVKTPLSSAERVRGWAPRLGASRGTR